MISHIKNTKVKGTFETPENNDDGTQHQTTVDYVIVMKIVVSRYGNSLNAEGSIYQSVFFCMT
eukprot:UN25269